MTLNAPHSPNTRPAALWGQAAANYAVSERVAFIPKVLPHINVSCAATQVKEEDSDEEGDDDEDEEEDDEIVPIKPAKKKQKQ